MIHLQVFTIHAEPRGSMYTFLIYFGLKPVCSVPMTYTTGMRYVLTRWTQVPKEAVSRTKIRFSTYKPGALAVLVLCHLLRNAFLRLLQYNKKEPIKIIFLLEVEGDYSTWDSCRSSAGIVLPDSSCNPGIRVLVHKGSNPSMPS